MKKIVIGTSNINKVDRIKKLLSGCPLEILSLKDIGVATVDPVESASDGVTIAAEKALGYIDQLGDDVYVLTQDDTIVFHGIDKQDDPAASIKAPVIEKYGEFTDENAMRYYSDLAKKYGSSIDMDFHYGHALAHVSNKNGRRQLELFAASSVLHTKISSKINQAGALPGYFFGAVMQLRVNDVWTDYFKLTEQQIVDADQDLKDAVIGLLIKAKLIKGVKL